MCFTMGSYPGPNARSEMDVTYYVVLPFEVPDDLSAL